MTQHPIDQAPAYQPAPVQKAGNGFGITALVLGIVAIVFSIIPLLGMIAFVLGPLAVIFGVIGVTRKGRKRGTSITGIILGIVAIILAAVVTAMMAAAVTEVDKQMNAAKTVEYKATAQGDAEVSFGTSSGTSNENFTDSWTETASVEGFDAATLIVTGDFADKDQKLSCEIVIDGVSAAKQSGTGMITCSGSTFGN